MEKISFGRLGARNQATSGDAAVAWPAGKVCSPCLNEGWTRRDLPTDHPAFGIPAQRGGVERCPVCHGASAGQRSERQAYAVWLARDHAETARIRQSLGLPSLGQPMQGVIVGRSVEPPPPDFARSGVPVPTTVTDEQRQRAQRQIARNVAAVAAKMGARR
jgi:hypothetical protein